MLEIIIGGTGLAPAIAALLVATSFLTSLITVTFGIGGGVLMLGVMASVLPAAVLIPVHGVVQLASNAGRAALFIRHVPRSVLMVFSAGTVVGAVIGGLVAVDLPGSVVQLGVGLFILWSLLAKPPRWLGQWPMVTAAVTTFLTMFFGATGPFVATYVRTLGLDRHAYTATHAALMTVQHGLKVVVFGVLGVALGPWIGLIAAMVVAGFCGTYVGRHALRRMSDKRFDAALRIVLVLLSLRLLWQGAASLNGWH